MVRACTSKWKLEAIDLTGKDHFLSRSRLGSEHIVITLNMHAYEGHHFPWKKIKKSSYSKTSYGAGIEPGARPTGECN
jgi:hypothetical protein